VRAGPAAAHDDAVVEHQHLVADQREDVRLGADGDDGRVALRVPDHVSEHGPVKRRQVIEQAVDQQQLRLVDAGRGEPCLTRDELGRGVHRHLGPRHQREPVKYRGNQQMPVRTRLGGAPGGSLDDTPDPDRRHRPLGPARPADLVPDGGAAGGRAHVEAEHPKVPVGRRFPAGQYGDERGRGS